LKGIMATRKFNPITPVMRHKVLSKFDDVTTDKPHKPLLEPITKSGGRNNTGKMTMRYRGGGHKRMYRVIDFLRDKHGVEATVLTVEYDPNRSSRIALVEYTDGEKRYIIAPEGLQVGQKVISGKGVAPEVGNTLFLSEIPLGSVIHNIELHPGRGASMARSAGSYAQLKARDGKYAIISLPSGEVRMVLITCVANYGLCGQCGSQPSGERQGRSQALVGSPSTCAWCCDEPGRSPHGWWRGQKLRWTPTLTQRHPRKRIQNPQHAEAFF
jgi:large subunit ribosomal protein L2